MAKKAKKIKVLDKEIIVFLTENGYHMPLNMLGEKRLNMLSNILDGRELIVSPDQFSCLPCVLPDIKTIIYDESSEVTETVVLRTFKCVNKYTSRGSVVASPRLIKELSKEGQYAKITVYRCQGFIYPRNTGELSQIEFMHDRPEYMKRTKCIHLPNGFLSKEIWSNINVKES